MQEKIINRKSSKIVKWAKNNVIIILELALEFQISFICFGDNEISTKIAWRNDDFHWKIDIKVQKSEEIAWKIIG